MRQIRYHSGWRCAAAAAVIAILPLMAAVAKESPASVKAADQDIVKGDLRAAEIELRNAVREAPQDPLIRAKLAKVYLKLGDPISAEREARAARERNGAEADYLPVLADALLRQGKFADVVNLVQPGNRPAALESQLRVALGLAAEGQHDAKKAEAMLRDAVRLDPQAVPAKVALARLVAPTNLAEANKLVDEAVATDPRSVEALQAKGEMLLKQGDRAGAMNRFDAALKIDPKNISVRLARAQLNISQDKFQAADEDLGPILKAEPANFMANYLRGLEFARKKNYTEADRIFERLEPTFSRFVSGYYLAGATKFELGQYAQAETLLGKYLARVSNDPRATRLIASAALRQRATGRAIEYLKPAVAKSPSDAPLVILLGNAYLAAGKPDLALQQFEKAAALEPKNPTIETRVALSEIGAGNSKQGLAELERVFDTEAGATVAGPTLVLGELHAGQPDKAAKVVAALIKRDGNNPLYLTLSGMVHIAQHDNAGAESAFRAALAKQPGFVPALRDLAQLYLATARPDEAKKIYGDWLKQKPNDVTALLGLANVAVAQKKWSEATDALNRARTAAPNDPAPGLALVRLYELRQDWTNAKSTASALSVQFPSDVPVLEAQARAQIGAGDINGAISSYKRAYELAPDAAQTLARYVALLDAAKYFREARNVLQAAVAKNPKNTSLKLDLIRATAQADGLDAAIAKANAYAKDDPTSGAYDLAAAGLYEKAGRVGDAVALLEKSAAARPADDPTVIALARNYIRIGDFGKAEAMLTKRLKADPKNTASRMVLAPLYLATGRPVDAEKVYNEVLAQKPNDVAALLGLADVAIAQKKWSAVTDDLARARVAAPNDPTPVLKLINFYGMRQDWKNATATADQLAAKFPNNVNVLDAQARAQFGAGDTAAAIATYKRAYALAPNSTPILSRYLAILNGAKNYTEVRNVLQAALARDPKNASVKSDLIRIEAKIGGLPAGIAKAQAFAKGDPDNSLYDLVAADLYQQAGKGAEAAALLEKDLAARPKDDNLRIGLARLYNEARNEAKAEAVLQDRLKTDPNNYDLGVALAALYLDAKKYDVATSEYNRLLAARPADPAVLNNLAWLLQQKGDLTKAHELAQRAVAAAPSAPQIDDTFGWILLAQGDTGKAVTYLTAANVSAPTNPAIQYHLAVALQKVGRAADAQAMLEKLLASGASFADKADAEKLLQQLKRG
jgi:putative PEP-CTERM system TPR-repeat lipoprotein